MRTCAVCGKRIKKRDLCNKCFRKWGDKGNYPIWLKELIYLQSSFERSYANRELTFADVGLDIHGEKRDEKRI